MLNGAAGSCLSVATLEPEKLDGLSLFLFSRFSLSLSLSVKKKKKQNFGDIRSFGRMQALFGDDDR